MTNVSFSVNCQVKLPHIFLLLSCRETNSRATDSMLMLSNKSLCVAAMIIEFSFSCVMVFLKYVFNLCRPKKEHSHEAVVVG